MRRTPSACAGQGQAEIPLEYNAEVADTQLKVHGHSCFGKDQGDELATFFSGIVGKDVRLMRSSLEQPRLINKNYHQPGASNQVAFGDGFPFLLTSVVSLAAQHHSGNWPAEKVPHERFRSNIRINGPKLEAYAEDSWRLIAIGSLAAFVVKACDRCAIPSVIQSGDNAGQKGDVDVLREFLNDRVGIDLTAPGLPEGRFFGQNLNHLPQPNQMVSIGDRVKVHARLPGPNIQLIGAV